MGTPSTTGSATSNDIMEEMVARIARLEAAGGVAQEVPNGTGRYGGAPAGAGKRPIDDGFCYLWAVRAEGRARAAQSLGKNPWFSDVVSWLENNVGEWSKDTYALTIGTYCVPDGRRAFVQCHLGESDFGITTTTLVQCVRPGMRLGSNVQQQGQNNADGGRSAVASAIRAPGLEIRMPFARTLNVGGSGHVYAQLLPRTSNSVVRLTNYFESAELIHFGFTATIVGTGATRLGFSIETEDSRPASVEAMASHPSFELYSGDLNQAIRAEYTLPSDHSFGREVRAVNVGNDSPTFHWLLESPDPASVVIRGSIVLRVAGTGVARPFDLPASK